MTDTPKPEDLSPKHYRQRRAEGKIQAVYAKNLLFPDYNAVTAHLYDHHGLILLLNPANIEHLALCWNFHDTLVGALQEIVEYAEPSPEIRNKCRAVLKQIEVE